MSVIIEGHEPPVEGRIPKGRKQQAVMHVQPVGVAGAILSGDDVACADDILANALNDQPLGLSGTGKAGNRRAEYFQWAIGQSHA